MRVKRFAKHLLCDAEKQHFQLLVAGFCRKFSTLTEEAFRNNIQSYRKAAFAVAWMKFLCNFHPGKAIQERMMVEKILKSAKPHFESQSVHSVLSVLHELIYSFIHDRVRVKKADGETTGAVETRTQLKGETDDVLFIPVRRHLLILFFRVISFAIYSLFRPAEQRGSDQH